MSTFTRITVIGTVKKATLVLPSSEPVGVHLVDIAALLDEPVGAEAGALTLVTPVGVEIDSALTLSDQEVVDGNVLLLIRTEDAPAPPEITDVTDAVAELRDTTARAWSDRHRTTAGAMATAVLAAVSLSTVTPSAAWIAWCAFIVLAFGSAALGLARLRAASLLMAGGALGSSVVLAALVSTDLSRVAAFAPLYVAVLSGLVWFALGCCFGVGRRELSAGVGAGIGVLFSALSVIFLTTGVGVTHSAAIIGLVAVAALGMLPALALTVSGTTALDDRVIAGLLPGRDTVERTVTAAYGVFAWTVYAIAFWLAFTAAWLVAQPDVWSPLLGAGIVVVTLLRTRVMPLATQAWPVWAAGAVGVLAGIVSASAAPSWVQVVILGVCAAAVVAATLASPSVQGRIRLRRLGDQLETLAALSLIPSVLGVFGVYEFMLGVF
ncbi:EsaB/YukD family protein [Agreia pratensis]|uniref:WXG100 protein secretion system (Wss), protein YukD n=1 Tax=Agreia pratensis TaxID=150121 RepID=A0A1X7JNG9_9MICO|nr:EsaB/YukD family protein [Agreia pratensis]SMG28990.1 WXG100 protein secretion system (Wss), protein YukD [Agreia pratensis]